MALFTVHIRLGRDANHIDYDSIDACMSDAPLANLLDTTETDVTLWAGTLRLTGTPVSSSRELYKALVENSKTILRRLL
jgi:biotin operon repressor